MIGWGIFLVILGLGSLLLPMIGFQFRLMELVEDFQPWAGLAVAAIGFGLIGMGITNRREEPPPTAIR